MRSRTMRSPSSGDRDGLLWFFERGAALCGPSSFASHLERQLAVAFDSRGHRLARTPAWTFARSVLHRHRPADGSCALDEDSALRAASVARRLRAVAAVDPTAAETLGVYFGPCGAAAAHTRFGRLLALVPLVPHGAVLAAGVDAGGGGAAVGAFEALARHLVACRGERASAPLVQRALAQAEHRLVVAWRRYRKTARVERRSPSSRSLRGALS